MTNLVNKFGASSVAATVAMVALYPLDTVRRCLQMSGSVGQANLYKNEMECVRLLYQLEGGLRAFYRGLGPCVVRKVPSVGLTFVAFEYLRTAT